MSSRIVRPWREAINPARLIMAAKAAGAAALAWWLAPLIPFADSEYSYYAPLGVLISMHPTLAASARSGIHALTGLTIGVALGLNGLAIAPLWPGSGVVALALVVALRTLVAGMQTLRAGRNWVAIAAVFVLLLSGSAAQSFSSSYILTVGFGVLVGVAVNLAIAPPFFVGRAETRVTALRDDIARMLTDTASALANRDLRPDRLSARMDELASSVGGVVEAVGWGSESRRWNPRGRNRHVETTRSEDRLQNSCSPSFRPSATRRPLSSRISTPGGRHVSATDHRRIAPVRHITLARRLTSPDRAEPAAKIGLLGPHAQPAASHRSYP